MDFAQIPSFSAADESLHQAAIEATGLSDFGDAFYRDNLRAYLGALDEAGKATSSGRLVLMGQVVELLKSRLHTIAALKANPQVRDNRIDAPLVILGLPRTGTTALHGLLNCDLQLQGLQNWLATQPMPRPPEARWRDYPAYAQAQAALDGAYAAVPELAVMHFISAADVDECRAVMTQTFASTSLSWPSDLQPYSRWLHAHDMRREYAYYADVLRLIGAHEPHKTWLLKCPHHSICADALLAEFPNARLIFLHRDPASVVPSISSMVYRLRSLTEGEQTRPERCGEQMLDHLEYALQRLRQVRAAHPQNFMDLRFGDFMADPLRAVRSIYARFDLSLSEEAAGRMQRWLADNPQGKHGQHRYTPEDFGLSRERIHERFAGYDDY